MSLDWEQFKEIIEYKSEDNDKHALLMNIVNEQGFLIQFLTQLSKELKEIKTTFEIVDKFPQVGPLLTKAATHPYFGCVLSLAQLLVNCLINYSKLDLTSSNESVDLSASSNRSITWCIVRLRRFISASQQGSEQGKDTQSMIQKISELLDAKAGRLNPQKIARLTDKCLSLAHTEEARSIIEKLVAYALVGCTSSIHFDCPQLLLSDKFVYELANKNTQQPISLRTQYLSWPKELKQNLFICYEELLEYEILDLIENYITTTTNYIPIETLETQFMQNDFIQSLQNSPVLIERSLHYLSNYVIHYQHWSLVRLLQCLHYKLISPLNQRCQPLIKGVDVEHIKAQEVYYILMNYIYGEGSINDILKRRNEAWCLSLSFHRFTWYCVYGIVQWCKTDKLWSQQMEHTLVYLNWMIYPSLDNRESESLSFLRQWIQTCCGNNRLCDELPKRWHNLLNGNGVLITCFVTSIFFSNHFHVDQQKSLIRSIFVQRREGPQDIHGNTKKNDPDTALVYLFLDYLNDIELYADLYPPTTFDIKIIKNFMVESYLS